jgi:putative acetyltransferase
LNEVLRGVKKITIIRPEQTADIPAIRIVNLRAFPTPAEAGLVDALRARGVFTLSLVAEEAGRVVGHILFTPVTIGESGFQALGLAPMAVLPEFQNQGIGSHLVRTALDLLRKSGQPAVIVLGHADYYPHFNFVPASHYGIHYSVEVPDEVFMACELQPGALQVVTGVVRFQPEFDNV